MLQNSTIHTCLSNLTYTKDVVPKDVPNRTPLFQQARLGKTSHFEKRVSLSNHAVKRWNERVGPPMTKQQLTGLFQHLWNVSPYRFYELLKGDGIWMLDDEIIFAWLYCNHKYEIITFYGRKSENPALQNIKQLRAFNHQHHDEITLSLSEVVIKAQLVPYIPKTILFYSDRCFLYYIEEIERTPHNLFLVSVLQVNLQSVKTYTLTLLELKEVVMNNKLRNLFTTVFSQEKVLERV